MSMSVRGGHAGLLTLLLLLSACGGDAPPAADEAPPTPVMSAVPGLQAATSLGVSNARMPVPGMVTSGQLTQEQFDGLVAAGFDNFISLRLPNEDGAGWEEGHAAEVGATFARLPVAGAGGLTRETVDELARILDEAGEEGTVLYCSSGNRVGALLALKAHWVDGLPAEEALELGRAAGVARLEPTVMEMLGLGG